MVTLSIGASCKSKDNTNSKHSNSIDSYTSNNDNSSSNNSNNSNNKFTKNSKKQNLLNSSSINFVLTFGIWWSAILTLASVAVTVQGTAIYSNADFLANPNFEPICNAQQEHFIESDGKESSLILEFNTGVLAEKKKSCTRILSAPSNYGFIVRLILPKIRHSRLENSSGAATTTSADIKAQQHTATIDGDVQVKHVAGNEDKTKLPTAAAAALNEMTSLIEKINATALKTVLGRTCPLSIFSSLDPHTPQWRVDPCQLEDTAPEMEDPVRLFHGRVRIVWEHGYNELHSKLMVTALGKGDQCRSENKHQCLKIGDEPILCISKDLVCDGIRHCPYSNEYDSDEDYSMCWKRRRLDEPMPPAMETDIFEHFALEVFRNLFAFDAPTMPAAQDEPFKRTKTTSLSTGTPPSPNAVTVNTTTLRKVETKQMQAGSGGVNATNATDGNSLKNTTATTKSENSTETGYHRRNSTRSGLSSDLSKYGPWGYLMLGMLLCGGALLICGLWASASQHAANNEREAALQNAGYNGSSIDHHSTGGTAPPNYEELDPPPAYSVLFPNQKAASSATLSSLEASAMAASSDTRNVPTAVTVVPAATTIPPALADNASSSCSTQMPLQLAMN